MNRFSSFLLGMGVGVVGLYLTMHFTLVRASDGFHFVPKIAAKIESPYVDVRNFKLENWQRKQALVLSVLKANKGYLLQDQSLLGLKQSSQRMLDQFTLVAHTKSSN
jgi:hypothetical protein